MSNTRTNNTPAADELSAQPAAAPKLTSYGRALLRHIGLGHVSFFDSGVTADSDTWHDVLTEELEGRDDMPKTRTGVANVIDKLATDGYLVVSAATGDDGAAVFLTELGAKTANELAAAETKSDEKTSDTGSGELKGGDVQPLAKTTRGSNGTTKRGKTPAKKTGDPKADAAAAAAKKDSSLVLTPTGIKSKPAAKTSSKKSAAKPAAKKTTTRTPGKWSTKGQHVITNRRSRVTGTIVQLVNVNGEGSNMQPNAKGETYAKKCVDHDFALFAASRKLAWDGASDPSQWCPKCKRAAAKRAAADAK